MSTPNSGRTDWRTAMEQHRASRPSGAAPSLDEVARREIVRIREVVRRQVDQAAEAIREAIWNPALQPDDLRLSDCSPLRDLEPDTSDYDLVLSDDSLAGHRQTDSEFWKAAYAVAFADEYPGLDPIGALHFTQVLDAFRAIALSVAHDVHFQSSIACMQQGKSGSASAKYIFHPLVRWVLDRKKLHSFYLVPNLVGLADQIAREFSAKYQLFGPFRLRHPRLPRGVSVTELFTKVLRPSWESWDPVKHPAKHIIRATCKQSVQDVYHRKLNRIMSSADEMVQVLIDESDAASARTGVLDRMIGAFVNAVVRGEVSPCYLFLHTATPQEHLWTNNFRPVLEHQGAGYCGFPRHEGQPYPNRDGVEASPPLIVRYADQWDFAELDFRAYKDYRTWMKNIKRLRVRGGKRGYERVWLRRRDRLEPEWLAYWRQFEEDLGRMALDLLEHKAVRLADGQVELFPHARGVVVRPIDKNYDEGSADELAGALERHATQRGLDVKVVRFYGENARHTAKDIIRAEAGEECNYIVLVTGKARRGDAFPRHCAFTIDLTLQPCTLTAALQGLFGRMCGWGKQTAFFGSRQACNIIETYGRDGYAAAVRALTRIGYRVEVADSSLPRRLHKAVKGFTVAELLRDHVASYVADHPEAAPVLKWMDDVEDRINRQKRGGKAWDRAIVRGLRKRGRGRKVYSAQEENCREFLLSFVDHGVAEVLEQHPHLCCTNPEGKEVFEQVRLLHYEPNPDQRPEFLQAFREEGASSPYISTAGLSAGSYYGDHVGRRATPTTSRHTMGKATTYHGKGRKKGEHHYTLQLWYAEPESERVRVPRITLVLHHPHTAETVCVGNPAHELRALPESIYSNEVIVGAGSD